MRARSCVDKAGVVVHRVGIGWNLGYEVTEHG